MAKKNQQHRRNLRPVAREGWPPDLRRAPAQNPRISVQIPRPSVTEFTRITAVPVFADRERPAPSGSEGNYQVAFVLGIPGVNSVVTELDFPSIMASGDSVLSGAGGRVQYAAPTAALPGEFVFISNSAGRLGRVDMELRANDYADAERAAHDVVMPILSRMAVEVDVPIEVKATIIIEVSSEGQMLGASIVGAEKAAPPFTGMLTPELRPLVAAYREGLNCNAPSYQALSFFKVIEGVEALSKTRRRRAKRQGGAESEDPLLSLMPATLAGVPGDTPWSQHRFEPYLGRSFKEVKDSFESVVRNAVAHLTPGMDLRVPDFVEDLDRCREAVPILRYVARTLILAEMGGQPSAGE